MQAFFKVRKIRKFFGSSRNRKYANFLGVPVRNPRISLLFQSANSKTANFAPLAGWDGTPFSKS
jgi:hypothetical protein